MTRSTARRVVTQVDQAGHDDHAGRINHLDRTGGCYALRPLMAPRTYSRDPVVCLQGAGAPEVFERNGSVVDTTIVDGRVLMRGRKLLTLDETEILRQANEAFQRVRAWI